MKSSLLSIVEKVTLLFGYPLAMSRFWNQKVMSCPWHSVSDKVTYQTDGDIFDGQFVTIRFPPLPPTSSQNLKLTLVADMLASLFRFGKGGLWTTEKFSCHSSSNDEHHCPYTFNQNDPSNRCRINRKRAVNQKLTQEDFRWTKVTNQHIIRHLDLWSPLRKQLGFCPNK